jgi:hypothetical protein
MATIKDTADIRMRLLQVWKQVDEKKISTVEARLHIGIARAILETLKVEIAAAHLTQLQAPPVSLGRSPDSVSVITRRQ